MQCTIVELWIYHFHNTAQVPSYYWFLFELNINIIFLSTIKRLPPKFCSENIVHIALLMLGSKTLGTNVLELQFVLCWQIMIKTQSLGLGLLKVCLFVKLESSNCRIYWTKFARLDRSKIRLDRSNHVQIYFSAEFQFSPNST